MSSNSELIEKYLNGQLTPEEEQIFHKRILEDKEMRQMVEDAGVRFDDMFEGEIIEDEGSDDVPKSSKSMLWAVLIVIVCSVAFLVVKNVYFTKPVVVMADEENYVEQKVDMGADLDGADLKRMYQKVDAGEDLPVVIDSLKIAMDGSNGNVLANIEIKLYLAKAYSMQKDYANAMPLLQEVIASGDPTLANEAQFLYYKIHNKQ